MQKTERKFRIDIKWIIILSIIAFLLIFEVFPLLYLFVKSIFPNGSFTLEAFESEFNIKLPEDFKEFTMSPLGGLYMEVREEIWPMAQEYEVAPFWEFCRGIMVYGISSEVPEYLDLRANTRAFHESGLSDCIPFFSVIGDGEQIFCFDREGKIVVFDGYEMHDVEGDFESFLLGQIAELEERKDKKVEKLKNRAGR